MGNDFKTSEDSPKTVVQDLRNEDRSKSEDAKSKHRAGAEATTAFQNSKGFDNWLASNRKFAMIAFVALAWLASVMFIWIEKLGNDFLPSDFVLGFVAATSACCWAFIYVWRLSAKSDRIPPPPRAGSEPRVGVLFVHGMGVQDRFQMIGEIYSSLASYDRSETLKVTELSPAETSTYRSLKLSNDSEAIVADFHEAYWASKFSGLTSFVNTLIFSLKAIFRFIPTLFTSNWPKRLVELCWLVAFLAITGYLLTVVYGLFTIALSEPHPSNVPASRYLGDHWTYYFSSLSKSMSINFSYTNQKLGSIPTFETIKSFLSNLYLIPTFCSVASTGMFMYLVWASLTLFGVASKTEARSFQLGQSKVSIISSAGDTLSRASIIIVSVFFLQYLNRISVEPLIVPKVCLLTMSFGLLYGVYSLYKWWSINFAGDVLIYIDRDENRKFFEARTEAIDEVVNSLNRLTDDQASDQKYVSIVVVAHSLGTAIALEGIRKWYLQSDAVSREKLRGFVTVGSPLRKIRQLFNSDDAKSTFIEFNRKLDDQIFGFHNGVARVWWNYFFISDLFADVLSNFKGAPSKSLPDRSCFPVDADLNLKHNWFKKGDPKFRGVGSLLWQHSDYWLHPFFIESLVHMLLEQTKETQNPNEALLSCFGDESLAFTVRQPAPRSNGWEGVWRVFKHSFIKDH